MGPNKEVWLRISRRKINYSKIFIQIGWTFKSNRNKFTTTINNNRIINDSSKTISVKSKIIIEIGINIILNKIKPKLSCEANLTTTQILASKNSHKNQFFHKDQFKFSWSKLKYLRLKLINIYHRLCTMVMIGWFFTSSIGQMTKLYMISCLTNKISKNTWYLLAINYHIRFRQSRRMH